MFALVESDLLRLLWFICFFAGIRGDASLKLASITRLQFADLDQSDRQGWINPIAQQS
ncbi:MAG TPA: hypothetical protein V6D10_17235 [Trichocoleus sp.]